MTDEANDGAGDEERMTSRIAEHEAQLEELTQQRDALLRQLLKTPPQPRPKRDRGAKPKPTSGGVESAPPRG